MKLAGCPTISPSRRLCLIGLRLDRPGTLSRSDRLIGLAPSPVGDLPSPNPGRLRSRKSMNVFAWGYVILLYKKMDPAAIVAELCDEESVQHPRGSRYELGLLPSC